MSLFDKSQSDNNIEEVQGHYDELKDWKYDPKGYFLIRINRKTGEIEAAHCRRNNIVEKIIKGKKPQDIYFAACELGLISRTDHAAYFGKELEKAYLALKYNLKYVQDDELDMNKKETNGNIQPV